MSSSIDRLKRFVEEFLRTRASQEGFRIDAHSFIMYGPRRALLQYLLTGHLRNIHYMSKEDIATLGFLVSAVCLEVDPEFQLLATKYARYLAVKKDPPLISLITRVAYGYADDDTVKLLATFPPKLLVERFYNTFRSGLMPIQPRISKRFVRKILAKVVEEWEREGKLRYFAVKYPRRMATLVKLVMDYTHVDDEVMSFLLFKGAKVTDPLLRARLEYKRAIRNKEKDRAYELIVQYKLPFSLARQIPYSLYDARILDVLSPYDVAMFCDAFYRAIKEGKVRFTVEDLVRAIERKGEKLTQWYIARTFFVLASRYGRDDPIVRAWARVWMKKLHTMIDQLASLGLGLEQSRILLVLDGSGSMHPHELNPATNILLQGLLCWVPFFPLVNNIVMFSDDAFYLEPEYVHDLDRLIDLLYKAPNSGTCIECGLRLALEEVKRGEYTHVVLITDEQANVIYRAEHAENDIAREIAKHAKLIVHNPQPYPTHVITPSKAENIYAVYGKQAEDILASMILEKISNLDEEAVIDLVKKALTRTITVTTGGEESESTSSE